MKIFTGIKPTNKLHLGNYFGALMPTIALQEEHEVLMMIADLHAITVPQDPAELKKTILLTAATYLACGVDLQRTIMFQQSAVPAHSELAWILGTVAKMGELERMIQYKDKVTIKGESVSVGLFNYPVLMAADILLYQTEAVPVGVDQKQHLELTRALAERFNKDFGPAFLLPKPLISKEAAKIMGLDDPSIKMSKSAPNPKNYLGLLDSADEIATKIKAAVTDSEPTITADPNRAGVYNLLTIFSLVCKRSIDSIAHEYQDQGTKKFKDDLTTAVIELLTPIQASITQHLANQTELIELLAEQSERAQLIANKTLVKAKEMVGLLIG